MSIDVVGTDIEVPSLPSNCDEDSQNARSALVADELELENCLTFAQWIGTRLQDCCTTTEKNILQAIDDETIIFQASELRIVDQLDNLYLLLDPEVDGEAEEVNAFAIRMFTEFTA
jgi:hypothetical protein